jgi:nickel-dependent lactate racemase
VPRTVTVRHGPGGVSLEIPDGIRVAVAEPPPVARVPDETAVLHDALDAPAGAPPLAEAARGARRVAVVVPDLTRPYAPSVVLPAVLARLAAAGVPRDGVRIVVARGIHAAPSPDDLARIVPPGAAPGVPVEASSPDEPGENAALAEGGSGLLRTARGARGVAEADLAILVGSVVPHYLAGFSGGPKALVPGVADRATVEAAHRLTLDASVAPDGSVRSFAGRHERNPFYAALLDVARRFGRAHLVNLVLDDDGRVAAAAAGEVGAAHARAVSDLRRLRGVARPEPADLVIAGGGAPRDRDLIQAHKGLVAAVEAAKPGAPVVWFAHAGAGVGHARFLPWFETGRLDRHLAALRRDFHPYGLTAYALRWKAASRPVHVVSELPAEVLRPMGLLPFASGREALDHALARHRVETCTVLPRASETLFVEP